MVFLFLQPGADISRRDTSFSAARKSRCLTTGFASDARAKVGAIGSSSETTELHRRQLPTAGSDLGTLPSFGNNGWPGIKAFRATERFCTWLQMCSPGAAPERGPAFGRAFNAHTQLPPSERYVLQVSQPTGGRIQMQASCSSLRRG